MSDISPVWSDWNMGSNWRRHERKKQTEIESHLGYWIIEIHCLACWIACDLKDRFLWTDFCVILCSSWVATNAWAFQTAKEKWTYRNAQIRPHEVRWAIQLMSIFRLFRFLERYINDGNWRFSFSPAGGFLFQPSGREFWKWTFIRFEFGSIFFPLDTRKKVRTRHIFKSMARRRTIAHILWHGLGHVSRGGKWERVCALNVSYCSAAFCTHIVLGLKSIFDNETSTQSKNTRYEKFFVFPVVTLLLLHTNTRPHYAFYTVLEYRSEHGTFHNQFS